MRGPGRRHVARLALAEAAARGERVELDGDRHWSAAGHRVVADEVARALAQSTGQ